MHDGGGGGHIGGGHMGGHVGGHVGGHAVNPAHHHHGSDGSPGVVPGYISSDGLRRRGSPAVQRVVPAIAVIGVIVILFIVLLVV
jgi:hypothetical protein